ncbi:MAG: SIMPL domain-containing protein [Chloroflexota bacterium]
MRKSTLILTAVVLVLVAGAIAFVANWMQPATGRAAAASSPAGLLQAAPVSQGVALPQTGIVVAGEGTISVKPDLARVTLGVEVTNSSAQGAQQDAAASMAAVMAELKKQGIQEKDIQTVRFDLSPDYDYSNRNPVLKGYRATNLVLVIVRDISKVGGLLDAVVGSGATRLQGISFSVSDPAAAGAQGREEAMKNARAKAEQLAKLAGVTLGQPVAIEESVSAPPAPVEMAPRAMAAPAADTPISPGTQEVRTTVRVTYSIR